MRSDSKAPLAARIPGPPGEIRRVDSGNGVVRDADVPPGNAIELPAPHAAQAPSTRRKSKGPRAEAHPRRAVRSKRNDKSEGASKRNNGRSEFAATVARETSDRIHRDKLFDAVGKIVAPAGDETKTSHSAPTSENCFGFPAESLQRERQLIRAAKLSESVKSWFDIYSQVGNRPLYLWQWCVHGAELTTMTPVRPEWRRHVCDTKVLSIMLCVLLDDVADEQGNEDLLEVLMQIVERQTMPSMEDFSEKDRRTAAVTLELSKIYEARVAEYPLYEVYKRLLHFDLMQYFNTMRYSCLLNENLNLLNVTEHELYLPHAMHMMSFSTLDLMCTPDFQVHELGRYREAIWHAQCMGRVGNLLSTWEREIGQTDFTSGVFARAVVQGDLRVDQLRPCESPTIEAAIVDGGHEQHFLRTWYEHRECLQSKVAQIHSVDLQDFVERQERFFQMHLACRGAI